MLRLAVRLLLVGSTGLLRSSAQLVGLHALLVELTALRGVGSLGPLAVRRSVSTLSLDLELLGQLLVLSVRELDVVLATVNAAGHIADVSVVVARRAVNSRSELLHLLLVLGHQRDVHVLPLTRNIGVPLDDELTANVSGRGGHGLDTVMALRHRSSVGNKARSRNDRRDEVLHGSSTEIARGREYQGMTELRGQRSS